MGPAVEPIACVACSIFRDQIAGMQERGEIDLDVHYLPSMLHMDPKRLRQRLDKAISDHQRDNSKLLLLFGECHPHIIEQVNQSSVARASGINCANILLGDETYRALRREGNFFLLPEWTLRWKAIFQGQLGLNEEIARLLMPDLHTALLYLDTGEMPVPIQILDEISQFTGLPWYSKKVSSEHLLEAIRVAVKRLES